MNTMTPSKLFLAVDNGKIGTDDDIVIPANAPPAPVNLADVNQPLSAFARSLYADAEAALASSGATLRGGKGRGKGGVADYAQGRSEVLDINPALLSVRPGFNKRNFADPENQAHVIRTAHSIAKNGQLKPIEYHFEDGKFWLVDGEVRWRAIWYAINVLGAPILTAKVWSGGPNRNRNEESRIVAQVEGNNGGKRLEPLEIADNFLDLAKLGWPEAKIAEHFHLSIVHVKNALLVASGISREIRDLVTLRQTKFSTVLKAMQQTDDPAAAQRALLRARDMAKETGRDKVTPKHLAAALGTDAVPGVSAAQVMKTLRSVLGTAQFGTSRGVATITLTPDAAEQVRKLLDLA